MSDREAPRQEPEEEKRWVWKDGTRCTWTETLRAMAAYFGTFNGRWHPNEFWAKQAAEVDSLTEEEARERVLKIERDADADLEQWRAYQ